jgi:hypothetical protein
MDIHVSKIQRLKVGKIRDTNNGTFTILIFSKENDKAAIK